MNRDTHSTLVSSDPWTPNLLKIAAQITDIISTIPARHDICDGPYHPNVENHWATRPLMALMAVNKFLLSFILNVIVYFFKNVSIPVFLYVYCQQ